MPTQAKSLLAFVLCTVLATAAYGRTTYTGYSGAPGSNGQCAASCHGSGGGTITISGFPAQYTPGEVYPLTIAHSAGVTIRQFNGSCRIGNGSANAGTISAGTGTSTYNTSGETNGIRFTATNQNSGTFSWTAPVAGTGEVRLYVAGLQGGEGGQNSELILVATEATTGAPDQWVNVDSGIAAGPNYPNPFSDQTTLVYQLPEPASVQVEIFDLSGRRLEFSMTDQAAGTAQYAWDSSGYPSGIYFYRISTGGSSVIRSMLLVR